MRTSWRCVAHRYKGRREETNMVIINVKLLSGYSLQLSSLQAVSLETNRPLGLLYLTIHILFPHPTSIKKQDGCYMNVLSAIYNDIKLCVYFCG